MLVILVTLPVSRHLLMHKETAQLVLEGLTLRSLNAVYHGIHLFVREFDIFGLKVHN